MHDDTFDRNAPRLLFDPFARPSADRLRAKGGPAAQPDDGAIRSVVMQLLGAARDSIPDNPHLAVCHIDEARQLLTGRRATAKPRQGGLAPWQIRAVHDHVQTHLTEPLPMGALARLCRLSVSHFARAFKVSLGVTPHSFIVRQRLERVKELMLATRTPLAEIALACGLSDQSHMTRLFRRLEGCSPAAWRRRNGRLEELPAIKRSG